MVITPQVLRAPWKALAVLMMAATSGCSREPSPQGPADAPIAYCGSSTIGDHIITEAAKAFTTRTGIPFGAIETQGSGEGLAKLERGEAELVGVARPLTLEEQRQHFDYEIIGYDAVAIFVHPTNPVTTLTKAQLKAIYTGGIDNWKEVGGPDAKIVCITQVWGGKRAQMIEFQKSVMDDSPYREDRKECDRQSDQLAALVSEPLGITATSLSYAIPGVKAISFEGYAAEPRTVRSGAYLLSRPLLLVTPVPSRSSVKDFLQFILSAKGQEIVARSFVPVRVNFPAPKS